MAKARDYRRWAAYAALSAGLLACVVDAAPDHRGAWSYQPGLPPPPATTASATPLVVTVDPDRTLDASPGAGAGVFIEYQAGGHWTVSWTCDTGVTGQTCDFQIDVSVASGAISALAGQLADSRDTLAQPSAGAASATTITASSLDAITFEATPGARITVDAQIDGARDGSLFFFVQGGVINGGYAGALTDPLSFEPVSP
jgi:hypothetical protein